MAWQSTETTLRESFPTPTSYGTIPALPGAGQISVQEIGAHTSQRGLRITLNNVVLAVTNSSGAGWATLDLWTFVAGSLDISNAASDLTFTVAAGIPATSNAVVMSLGTAATADATLSGAEANAIASTAIPALVGSAGAFRAGANTTVTRVGGVAASVLRLNAAVTTGMTGNSSFTLSGVIDVHFTLARPWA